jgi:hypothetical protein
MQIRVGNIILSQPGDEVLEDEGFETDGVHTVRLETLHTEDESHRTADIIMMLDELKDLKKAVDAALVIFQ